jgi:hypothetical protein
MPRDTKLQQKIKNLSAYIAPVDDIPASVASIKVEHVVEPNMPVGVYVQEAFNIHSFVQDDREILVQRGLNWEVIDELPRRVDYLRKQESFWWKARFGPTPSQREYQRVKTLSDQVSSELLRDFEHLATTDDNIQEAVDNIKECNGDCDYAFDLKSLHLLSEREKDKLCAVGSDPKLLDTIKYCSEVFPPLLVQFEMEQSFAAYEQTVRNQAYTFLLVAVEEIRRCAAHAFWNDKKHLKGYQSEYFRKTVI